MGNKENDIGTGYHYSKEFKDRFISEWNKKYRYLFTDVIPDRNNVKKIYLTAMADIMITEFPEEAMKHSGDDIKKLIQNLYHCYIRWIEDPTKTKYEKYEVEQQDSNSNSIITSVTDTTTGISIHSDNDDVRLANFKVELNEPVTVENKINKYTVVLQYGKSIFGIVFKWITVSFEVSAKDTIGALAKAYEKLWRNIGDINHIKVREREIMVKQ